MRRLSRLRCCFYLVALQTGPIHLAVKVEIELGLSLAVAEKCTEPLTFSELTASIRKVPSLLIPWTRHSTRISTLLPVEVSTVRVQDFRSGLNGIPWSSCLLVIHCFLMAVFAGLDFRAAILSLIRARCSGVSFSRSPAGIGISALVTTVVVTSQRPVLTFRDCTLSTAPDAVEQESSATSGISGIGLSCSKEVPARPTIAVDRASQNCARA